MRSAHIILLEFTGRRSGRRYRMPVSYWQRGDGEVICLTSTAWSRWWVNLDGADSGCLRHNAQDSHDYGVDTDPQGQPTVDGLTVLADSAMTKVVRITVDPRGT